MKSWIVHPGWTISNRQAGKLWRARSRLYQRQFLQVNTHFSGFFEIYQIHIPSHRCKFKICRFFQNFPKISANFRDFAKFCRGFAIFRQKFDEILFCFFKRKILSEFHEHAPNVKNFQFLEKMIQFCEKSVQIPEMFKLFRKVFRCIQFIQFTS